MGASPCGGCMTSHTFVPHAQTDLLLQRYEPDQKPSESGPSSYPRSSRSNSFECASLKLDLIWSIPSISISKVPSEFRHQNESGIVRAINMYASLIFFTPASECSNRHQSFKRKSKLASDQPSKIKLVQSIRKLEK